MTICFINHPRVYAALNLGCPVDSFELYLVKRNTKPAHFFECLQSIIQINATNWYTSVPYRTNVK